MRTHSGEKLFRCEQCNYSCTQAGDLKRHKLKHTGENPFACKQCSYSCSRSNGLKLHMLSHTGEKPFACKQCNFSCKLSNRLKKHIRKHNVKTNAWKGKNENFLSFQFFVFSTFLLFNILSFQFVVFSLWSNACFQMYISEHYDPHHFQY